MKNGNSWLPSEKSRPLLCQLTRVSSWFYIALHSFFYVKQRSSQGHTTNILPIIALPPNFQPPVSETIYCPNPVYYLLLMFLQDFTGNFLLKSICVTSLPSFVVSLIIWTKFIVHGVPSRMHAVLLYSAHTGLCWTAIITMPWMFIAYFYSSLMRPLTIYQAVTITETHIKSSGTGPTHYSLFAI